MGTGNSAPAAPSAHPDTERQVTRDISTLVAGNDTGLSPRFVVVSRFGFKMGAMGSLTTTIGIDQLSSSIHLHAYLLKLSVSFHQSGCA
jgi:hypothetical protein